MNAEHVVIVAATLAAVQVVLAVRSISRQSTRFVLRTETWKTVQSSNEFGGLYKRNLRCSKTTFKAIVSRVQDRWLRVNERNHHNTVFGIRDRVAVTLFYLTHSTGFAEAGQVFGISATRTHHYVRQVTNVVLTYMEETIALPKTSTEWTTIMNGFEQYGGIPNVVGIIDGSLIPIKRFQDHEGWYCRKGFPAIKTASITAL
ncbi:putative nuclease harbi1 [Aphanomyces cochlioides]|nr:putative nuclease harbi1 [Aphanomyces cochlioides]